MARETRLYANGDCHRARHHASGAPSLSERVPAGAGDHVRPRTADARARPHAALDAESRARERRRRLIEGGLVGGLVALEYGARAVLAFVEGFTRGYSEGLSPTR